MWSSPCISDLDGPPTLAPCTQLTGIPPIHKAHRWSSRLGELTQAKVKLCITLISLAFELEYQ